MPFSGQKDIYVLSFSYNLVEPTCSEQDNVAQFVHHVHSFVCLSIIKIAPTSGHDFFLRVFMSNAAKCKSSDLVMHILQMTKGAFT